MTDSGSVLDRIVARKRVDVAARLGTTSLADLLGRAEPTRRGLRAALAHPGARFVMEVKRVSPSEGALARDVDPVRQARAYAGAADAISVLTDTPFFGGSLADLEAVRSAFSGPLLAKDFVVDARQVAEARLHGADAVLVMLSVLDDSEAADVIETAHRLGMDALVEAHDEVEVRRAIALGAPLIGINNRDLKTLKVDLAVTERLARLVPADRVVVAESGIAGRADVERLAPHADAFLVGSALMKADRPAEAARALAFGRVKVCGLTDAHDAELAVGSGAAFAGLIMVPNTPRAVTLAEAERVATGAADLPLVGVFRNEDGVKVAEAARTLGLHAVQLHGREDEAYIVGLRRLLPDPCEIWAAGAVGPDIAPARPGADRTLFDTAIAGQSGGTGRVFDWSRIAGRDDLASGLLAGGLTASNARDAGKVGAYALDVGSGVERAPGRKDAGKLAAFFEALRVPARAACHPRESGDLESTPASSVDSRGSRFRGNDSEVAAT